MSGAHDTTLGVREVVHEAARSPAGRAGCATAASVCGMTTPERNRMAILLDRLNKAIAGGDLERSERAIEEIRTLAEVGASRAYDRGGAA